MRAMTAFVASLILVSLTACSSTDSTSPTTPTVTPAPSGGSSSTVTIPTGASLLGDRAFNPGEVTIAAGGTITWVNADNVTHTSTANANAWDSSSIAPGQRFSVTFASAGQFPYHCAIHPGMVGTVVVQ